MYKCVLFMNLSDLRWPASLSCVRKSRADISRPKSALPKEEREREKERERERGRGRGQKSDKERENGSRLCARVSF